MKKKSLSVEEIQRAVVVIIRINNAVGKRIMHQALKFLSGQVQETEPLEKWSKVIEKMAYLIARRLKRNRRRASLFSSRDIPSFAQDIFEVAKRGRPQGLNSAQRKFIIESVRVIFEDLISQSWDRDQYWRWIFAVMAVSEERKISVSEILLSQAAMDAVLRKVYSRAEFVALNSQSVAKGTDYEVMKDVIFLKMLMDSEVSGAKQRRDAQQGLEQEFGIAIRMKLHALKKPLQRGITQEALRIYGRKRK